MATLRLTSGLVLLALLVPLAAAAPAEGRLQVEGAIAVGGTASLAAPGGDIRWEGDDAPDLVIHAEKATIVRRGTNHTTHNLPLVPGARVSATDIADEGVHESATLTLRAGEGAQLVVLRSDGPLDVRAPSFDVRPVAGINLFRGRSATDPWNCRTEQCVESFGVYEALAPASEAATSGTLTLFLRGPTLLATDATGEKEYASGVSTRANGALTSTEDAWIQVVAEGATATLQAAGPAAWYAAAPRLEAATLRAEESTGAVEVGAMTYRAQGDALDATGRLVLEPDRLADTRIDLTEGQVVPATGFATALTGDVATISLRAVPVFADTAQEQVGLIALLGAAAALLVYYWPHVAYHATSAALPLYTRLKRPEILDNDVRNSIYDIIRANPGISARAVQRQSELSWGTVVYHLRQLERHHLVVSRALGRTRNYYENHGKYKGMEVQLACLQSPRALVLARLVLQQPGMTQETLAQASGFPQPTTSYYVRKLKQATLVEEQREGRYARYVPGAELARYMQLADAPARDDGVAAVPLGV